MRATEFIIENRQGVINAIRKELPGWPDYVIQDMLYAKLDSDQDFVNKIEHIRELKKEVSGWELKKHMPLTFDMLAPTTRYKMKIKRNFGEKNPFMVPKDKERLEQAIELVKTKGMENLPPIIMLQTNNGLELWEGWHRTMAAFRLHPDGFKCNAYIGYL